MASYSPPVRWILCLLSIYAAALVYISRSGMAVAIITMVSSDDENRNLTESPRTGKAEFEWSETLQGIILGSQYYLYIIVPTIAGRVTDRFGAKWIVFAGAAGPCILSAITPVITRATGSTGLIVIRTLIGAFHGMVYSGIFSLNARWYPAGELATANAGLVFGSALGSAAMFLLAGWLATISWTVIFYVNAGLYIPWMAAWMIYCTNDPSDNGRISAPELVFIRANVAVKTKKQSARWSAIFTSFPVLTSLITKCCCGFGYYLLQTKMPSYLASIHSVPIFTNGLFNSATTVAHGVCGLLAAPLANAIIRRYQHCLRLITVRKAFQTVAMLGPAICFALIPILGHAENSAAVISLLVSILLLYGFYTGGEWSTIAEYAPNSAGVIFGFSSILSFSQGVVAPYLIGLFLDASDDRLTSWNIIFYLTSGIYVFGCLVFIIGGTDVHQEWDKTEEEKIKFEECEKKKLENAV